MFQANTTKYIGPTNFRGSRIKATAAAGSVNIPSDGSLSLDARHAKAAQALAEKFGWSGVWYAGGMPDGRGNVYVNAENLTDQRQTKWGTIYSGTITDPRFKQIYAPLQGIVVNAGFKIKM